MEHNGALHVFARKESMLSFSDFMSKISVEAHIVFYF